MTLPVLSDSLLKTTLAFVLVLSAYFLHKFDRLTDALQTNSEKYESILDSLQVLEYENELFAQNAFRNGETISREFGVRNVLFIDSTGTLRLSRLISELPEKAIYRLEDIFLDYQAQEAFFVHRRKRAGTKLDIAIQARQRILSVEKLYRTGIIALVVAFIFCYVEYAKRSAGIDYVERKKAGQLPEYYERCQSCGRGFSSMVRKGSEKDGSASGAFCDSCYKNGEFTEPDLTSSDVKLRYPKLKGIDKLERWSYTPARFVRVHSSDAQDG